MGSQYDYRFRLQLSQLFPGRNMEAGSLSVITIATRTENDMSAWSDEMETERELLTEHYVAAAKEICARQESPPRSRSHHFHVHIFSG